MNFKYTPNTLKKVEQLFEEAKYRVRYEKGHFNSGFCILEDKKVVIINKFLDIEGRINALIDILPQITVVLENLDADMKRWYRQLLASNKDTAVQTQLNLLDDEN